MIPKIVHVTWKYKNIVDSSNLMVKYGLKRLIELNPDWKVTVYDDDDINQYLKEVMDINDFKLIENSHIVSKSDTWRLYKMYNEGGIYVDMDRLCNKKLSDIIPDDVKWVVPIVGNRDFAQDLMISEPQNPIFLETIKLCMHRRRNGETNIYTLGPQTYMHVITHQLLNRVIDVLPDEEEFVHIRNAFKQFPWIKVVTEHLPYDTFLYSNDGTIINHELLKRSLYKEYDMRHWTNTW